MSNITELRVVFHADAADLEKIKADIGIDGSVAVYESLSLLGTPNEDNDGIIMDAGIEMQVDGRLSIAGLHSWGVYGYTFCQIVTHLREIAPSLSEVYLEEFDPLLDFFEVDLWSAEESSWYQSRVMQAEFASGLLLGVHYVVEHSIAEEGKEFPTEVELDLQREAMRAAYNQAAKRGWFGFNIDRTPLHG